MIILIQLYLIKFNLLCNIYLNRFDCENHIYYQLSYCHLNLAYMLRKIAASHQTLSSNKTKWIRFPRYFRSKKSLKRYFHVAVPKYLPQSPNLNSPSLHKIHKTRSKIKNWIIYNLHNLRNQREEGKQKNGGC